MDFWKVVERVALVIGLIGGTIYIVNVRRRIYEKRI